MLELTPSTPWAFRNHS